MALIPGSVAMVLAVVAAAPPELPVSRVEVELLSRDRIAVTLRTPSPLPGDGRVGVRGQRLLLGGVPIPVDPRGLDPIRFEIDLARVPEGVLGLDHESVPFRWAGLARDGAPRIAAVGVLGSEQVELDLPLREIYETYVRRGPTTVSPGIFELGLRMLVSFYNPFSFDVVARSLQYRLMVGGIELLNGSRPGFRLRARQGSDVLIEETVPLATMAGGVAGLLLRQEPVVFQGVLILATPGGDRQIPIGAVP
jgi:hypothetical protein